MTPGAPITARVYERKADISPCGRWLIYAAFGKGPDLPYYGSGYTVLAEAPSLSARVFMPSDSTWFGGGVFRPDGALCLRAVGSEAADSAIRAQGVRLADWPPVDAPPPRNRERSFDNLHWRLIRDGWSQTETGYARLPPGGGRLEKTIGRIGERHLLAAPDGAESCDASGWEWAERLGDEILYAEAGDLFRLKPGAQPRRVASIAPATD